MTDDPAAIEELGRRGVASTPSRTSTGEVVVGFDRKRLAALRGLGDER